ncbi:MAG: carboxypeptidase-like regulatory domain-containing protein [Saprospiraceae bacterium]|nr:carboxypeptidase-like regulatory domain-containing protein [Saprospiraceae bacterium]
MNKITVTLTVLLLFAAILLSAQTATLTGVLTDESNGSPLINATVQAGDEGTITDFNGQYELQLAPGDYEIVFSFVGLETVHQTVTLKPNETRQLNMALPLSANILRTATVTSGKHERALGEVTVSLDVLKPTSSKTPTKPASAVSSIKCLA